MKRRFDACARHPTHEAVKPSFGAAGAEQCMDYEVQDAYH